MKRHQPVLAELGRPDDKSVIGKVVDRQRKCLGNSQSRCQEQRNDVTYVAGRSDPAGSSPAAAVRSLVRSAQVYMCRIQRLGDSRPNTSHGGHSWRESSACIANANRRTVSRRFRRCTPDGACPAQSMTLCVRMNPSSRATSACIRLQGWHPRFCWSNANGLACAICRVTRCPDCRLVPSLGRALIPRCRSSTRCPSTSNY